MKKGSREEDAMLTYSFLKPPLQMLTAGPFKMACVGRPKKYDVYSSMHLHVSSEEFDSEVLLEFHCPKERPREGYPPSQDASTVAQCISKPCQV